MNLSNVKGKINVAKIFRNKGIGIGNKNAPTTDRLPPGQRLLNNPEEFPVLDLGFIPQFNSQTYRFKVFGNVENEIVWDYSQLLEILPKTYITEDFHCVTRWSQYDIKWAGIKYLDLEDLVKPKSSAKFVIQYGLDGYTTNVPLNELRKDNVLLAYELKDKPLPAEHGAPLRLIIPHLYAWKGSKFLNALEYLEQDVQGFWEVRGYHNHGNPWKEERYS